MKTLKIKSIFFSLLAIMVVTVFMVSCEQEVIPTPDLPNTSEELTLQKVAEILGVNQDELTESEDGYLHGNCMFYERELFETDTTTLETRWHSKIKELEERPTGTYYYTIDSNIDPLWQTKITKAINKWNSLEGAFHFTTEEEDADEDKVILQFKDAGYTPTTSPTRHNITKGIIDINKDYSLDITDVDITRVVMHEIGHFIGLGHVDGLDPEGGSTMIYMWTPEGHCRDANMEHEHNIMNSDPRRYNLSPNFTYCDKKAYEALHERVFIKAKHSNAYLCSEHNYRWARADRTELGPWEKFYLKYNKDTDTYAIQGSNSLYAELEPSSGRVRFESYRSCYHCQWILEKIEGPGLVDLYHIKNDATGKYLQVTNNHNYEVRCLDTNADSDAEVFRIRKLAWCDKYKDCK